MIRQHEKNIVWQAGLFTVVVHGLLLALFLVSFQWKTVQPMNIAQVELWDSIPSPKAEPAQPPEAQKPEPTPEPETPKVVEPVKPEPKAAPEPEPKAEIQTKKAPETPPKVEKAKPEPIKPKEEKPKEPPKEQPKAEKTKADLDALKKLQQALLAEDAQTQKRESAKPEASPAGDKSAQKAQAGSPNAGEVDKYKGLISNKIKQHVNKQLCGTDKLIKVAFMIALMPTGEVMGRPKLVKESGMPVCDDAVERAILESQPLPVPTSADLFSQFRELNLVFRPNDTN